MGEITSHSARGVDRFDIEPPSDSVSSSFLDEAGRVASVLISYYVNELGDTLLLTYYTFYSLQLIIIYRSIII